MIAKLLRTQIGLIALGSLLLAAAAGCAPTPTQLPQVTEPLPPAAFSPTAPLPTPVAFTATSLPSPQPPTDTALPPTATLPPTPVPATVTQAPAYNASGPYAVVNVAEDSVLVVHEAADAGSARVLALKYDDTGLMRTGRSQQAADVLWWELALPGSKTGWVNSAFLTEEVAVGTFCADARITSLLADLKRAYNTADGALYSSLVSPFHGLDVTYMHTGRTANYSTEEAKYVFTSTYVMNWGMHPASGLDVKGTFHEEVLPRLLEVLNAGYTLTCNAPGPGATNYTMNWPSRYQNIRYMALFKPGSPGVELDWRVWLIGFEYVEGKPYLFSMIHFFWEP